jgi:hypothetical protein
MDINVKVIVPAYSFLLIFRVFGGVADMVFPRCDVLAEAVLSTLQALCPYWEPLPRNLHVRKLLMNKFGEESKLLTYLLFY